MNGTIVNTRRETVNIRNGCAILSYTDGFSHKNFE